MTDVMVNEPQGGPLDWDRINWPQAERDVTRLRRRIFAAERAGDRKKVASLQRLMLRSRSNTLVSVRQVTELNAGRKTAGIDGKTALMSRDKAELVDRLHRSTTPWRAQPVKRVNIPKSNGKLRPLGIPTITDRTQQNRVRNALEPQWEARFEPRSFGFRPGRGCHDAIEATFSIACGKDARRLWVLDADLKAAFDHIDHDFLLHRLEGFPARGLIHKWLKAGVIEKGCYSPTEEGTPQGGVISPLLLNIALHGMEEAAGVRYIRSGTTARWTKAGCPALVRYADDVMVFCHTRQQAEQAKQRLAEWLKPRGLIFNEEKTRIVHLAQGCDFLGFNIRRYGDKLLTKPNAEAIKKIRRRLREEIRTRYGANATSLISTLPPIIRGWAAYYRTKVSARTFSALDHYLWQRLYKWARYTHPNKPKRWVVDRYFGKFAKSRQDRWVFGNRDTGRFIPKFSWTKIIRHVMVKGTASPDDPTLTQYWENRRRKQKPPPLPATGLRLLKKQKGRCAQCGDFLLHAYQPPQTPNQWEQWLSTICTAIRSQHIAVNADSHLPDDRHLIHAQCQTRHNAQHTATPSGLA